MEPQDTTATTHLPTRRPLWRILTSLALTGTAALLLSDPASAARSCVAELTHDPAVGAPGVNQRNLHLPGYGRGVAAIAHQTPGQCFYPFGS